jgi:non-specific serine/threonine protein kinase
VGDRWGIAYCLELGGRVAAARGRWAEGAQLLAGALALREAIGTQLEPDELEAHEHLRQAIGAALGEERLTVLWSTGSSLALDKLLALLASALQPEGANP